MPALLSPLGITGDSLTDSNPADAKALAGATLAWLCAESLPKGLKWDLPSLALLYIASQRTGIETTEVGGQDVVM